MAYGTAVGLVQPGVPAFPGQWGQPLQTVPQPGSGFSSPGSPGGSPLPPSATIGVPPVAYDPSDPLGQYFLNNPVAGDTWAQLKAALDAYGLQDLYDFVKNGIVLGWDTAQVYQHLRETPTYKTRFAGNAKRVEAGLQPLSESEYLSNEKAYAQAAKSVGLPAGFYDQPSDFVDFIGKDMSPAEYQDRLIKGYQTAMMSDHPTKLALQQMYGVTDGELAAYWIDPDRTEALLTKQFTAAQLGGAASRTGWGGLSRTQAEDLVSLGVDSGLATTGFNKLAQQHELMQGLPGNAGEGNIGSDTQLAAAFGNDAGAQQQIIQRQAQRVAAFAGGGGYESDKTGKNAGIGVAQ